MRKGVRVAAPLFPATFALGASFGVLARSAHFSALAAVVMSATTFAGSAQVATSPCSRPEAASLRRSPLRSS